MLAIETGSPRPPEAIFMAVGSCQVSLAGFLCVRRPAQAFAFLFSSMELPRAARHPYRVSGLVVHGAWSRPFLGLCLLDRLAGDLVYDIRQSDRPLPRAYAGHPQFA